MLATLCCHVRASSCSSFSGCEAWALALTGFNTCGSRLQSTGSTAVAHGLSCSAARGIVPDQVSNPRLLHLQVASLPLSHQGSGVRRQEGKTLLRGHKALRWGKMLSSRVVSDWKACGSLGPKPERSAGSRSSGNAGPSGWQGHSLSCESS